MAIIKPLIQKLWASGGAIVQPSDTKIETGWTAEVPPHQWENWIQNRQDQYLAHINERGIPEWDSSTDYIAHKSYVQGSDGNLYVAVIASGPSSASQDPVIDVTEVYWANVTKNGVVFISATGTTSWNVPSVLKLGLKKASVEVYGGGGGGGSKIASPGACGGGQGGIAHKLIDLTGVSTVSITVGAGGAGGSSDGVNGLPGGTTSFGAYVSATGGAGGSAGLPAAAIGGNGIGGDFNISGGYGGLPVASPTGDTLGGQGGGGSSPLGAAGAGATVRGHGGGGRSAAGESGANGLVIIRW